MTTVQSKVTDSQDLQPFFWLRISGLPYYFFSTVHGTPFAQPTGYPSTWAQHGMMLPDDTVDQKLQDIVGGVATPERMRITLLDFEDPLHAGFGYLSRLLAPGRVLSSTTAQKGDLQTNITADGSTSTFDVAGGTWPANSDVYVGAETIGVSQVAADVGNNLTRLTIKQRNKYPAYGTHQVYDTNYPPVPYHRVDSVDATGQPTGGTVVCDDVITIYGRAAAVYMGHFTPDGTAETEVNAACLLVGNITAVDVDQDGTGFQLTIESVTSQLDKALVAPDLASTQLPDGYYVQGDNWNQFWILTGSFPGSGEVWKMRLADRRYGAGELAAAINAAIGSAKSESGSTGLPVSLKQTTVDGRPTWVFSCITQKFALEKTGGATAGASSGLYSLLGFDFGNDAQLVSTDPLTAAEAAAAGSDFEVVGWQHVTAGRPSAALAIPTAGTSGSPIRVRVNTQAARLFIGLNESVGSNSLALIRLGDGQIGYVDTFSAVSTVTNIAQAIAELTDPDISEIRIGMGIIQTSDAPPVCYYVEQPGQGSIEQIISFAHDDASAILGRVLCSTRGATADDEFNTLPEGVGLGWNAIVKKDDLRLAIDAQPSRSAIVDRTTKFSDIFRPIAREYGLFIVWDPTDGLIHMRRVRKPSAAEAQEGRWGSSFVFSEANRSSVKDRTTVRQDRTSLRSSWKLSRGWDFIKREFKDGPLTINSNFARSFYPTDSRVEELEDKTLLTKDNTSQSSLDAITRQLVARTSLYQFPWMVWRRSVNKTGLMLSPGTYHQIVDNTIANPFTGARGITSGDGVYVMLGATSKKYSTGECTVELYAFSTADNTAGSQVWSPTGLIDFSAANNGYNAGTKVLTMKAHYTAQTAAFDGIDFAVGDKIRVVSRHNDSGLQYTAQDTITAISATGSTITLTTGLASALSSLVESIVILDRFHLAPTTRKSGGVRPVAWQGNGATNRIDNDATTKLCKWQ